MAWTIDPSKKEPHTYRIRDGAGEGVAICGDLTTARWIAATPDMLQALKRAQSRLCEHCPQYLDSVGEQIGDHTDECLEAMDAIAKAEGERK